MHHPSHLSSDQRLLGVVPLLFVLLLLHLMARNGVHNLFSAGGGEVVDCVVAVVAVTANPSPTIVTRTIESYCNNRSATKTSNSH